MCFGKKKNLHVFVSESLYYVIEFILHYSGLASSRGKCQRRIRRFYSKFICDYSGTRNIYIFLKHVLRA